MRKHAGLGKLHVLSFMTTYTTAPHRSFLPYSLSQQIVPHRWQLIFLDSGCVDSSALLEF
jgi:hypothetical protein